MRIQQGRPAFLLARTEHFLRRMASPRRHHIAAGMLLSDGGVVLGANIVSNLGVASVCAEQVALGEALKSPNPRIDLIAALRATFRPENPLEIVAPCGRCREILLEYAPKALVMLPGPGSAGDDPAEPDLAEVSDLLPAPFTRRLPDAHSGAGAATGSAG